MTNEMRLSKMAAMNMESRGMLKDMIRDSKTPASKMERLRTLDTELSVMENEILDLWKEMKELP